MKKLIKYKRSMAIVILLLMLFVVFITAGSQGDEKSKYGYTVYYSKKAVTHINKLDLNIVSPQNYNRYFPDSIDSDISREMKRVGADFLTLAPDYTLITGFCILPENECSDNISIEKRIIDSQKNATISSDFTHDDITLGDMDFHRVCYFSKNSMFLDYNIVVEYFTYHKGYCLEIKSYYETEDLAEADIIIKELCEENEALLAEYSYGEPGVKLTKEAFLWSRWKSLNFAPWVLLLPFVYALLCGITFTGFSEKIYDVPTKRYRFVGDEGTGFNEDFLSRNTSKMLLGFFSILIVFHHLVQHSGLEYAGLLGVLEDYGVCFVGMFFFFSGFGLFESFKHKKNYLKGFFKKRIPTILIPFYTIIIIFLLYELSQGVHVDTTQILYWLSGWILINPHMWYIVEIVILYILFFLFFRFIKNSKISIILLFISVGLMITGSLLLGHGEYLFQGEWWYNTTLLFPIGVLFAMKKDNIVYFMKRFYVIILPIITILYFVFAKLSKYTLMNFSYWSESVTDKGYDDKIICLLTQIPMVILFVALILLISLKLKIGNKVLVFLGNISLELYLIHNLYFSVFTVIKGTGAFYASVLVASLLTAALLHIGFNYIFSLLYKRPFNDIKNIKVAIPKYISDKKDELRTFKRTIRRRIEFAKNNKRAVKTILFRDVICILLCIVSIVPILILLINATQSRTDIIQGLSFLPGGKFAENFSMAKGYMASLGLNLYEVVGRSCIISVSCTFIGTYIGTLCAYGFEYYEITKKKFLWWMVLGALMIPTTASSVGFMKMVSALHLHNHLFPIIMVGISIPACVYFMRMYLQTFSVMEIIEAARIDGCKELTIFNKIILPILRPAILLQLTINFANSWNNTLYQNLVLTDIHKKSISVFLNTMSLQYGNGSDPVVYSFLLISVVPSLIIYIFFSRGITAHINLGSIKE